MRPFLAALALAGAQISFTAARASEPVIQLAQMARDVTDAVRKQRNEQRDRLRTNERTKREGKR